MLFQSTIHQEQDKQLGIVVIHSTQQKQICLFSTNRQVNQTNLSVDLDMKV
jgi:uncharacterized membrane protein YgcG